MLYPCDQEDLALRLPTAPDSDQVTLRGPSENSEQ